MASIPTFVFATAQVSYLENASPVRVSSALLMFDLDSPTIFGARISISGGYQAGQDLLAFTAQSGITGSFNAATGVLTLSGAATQAQYQAVLRSVTYRNSSDAPVAGTRTIGFQVNDGSSLSSLGNLFSLFATARVNVTAVNDAPLIGGLDAMLYTGVAQGLQQVIDNNLTVTDPDSNWLSGARVSITGHYMRGQDYLSFVSQNGISGWFDPNSGMLTLMGVASAAAYQTALRSVTYSNAGMGSADLSDRTLSFQVMDSSGANSLVANATLKFAVAPVVTTTPGTLSYTEGDPATVVDSSLTVTDVDDVNFSGATVRISVGFQAGDTLVFVNTANISGVYNSGTGVLTLSGTDTVAAYQAALRSITFQGTSDNPVASKTVAWTVTDGDHTSLAATRVITVTPVNDAPVIDAQGATLGYTEDDPASVISPAATLTDPDSGNFNGGSLTVSFTANGTPSDQLAIRHEGGGAGQIGVSGSNVTYGGVLIGTFSGGTNGSDLVISFTSTAATQAAVQALVRNITFANTSDDPSTLARTVTFTVVDGDGGTDTDSTTATVNVSAATDVPVVTTTSGSSAYTEGGSAAIVDPALLISDADDVDLESATVSISAGFQDGDQLVFVDTPQITGSYNSGTGVLTLTGTDTLANYQAALRSITFSTSNDNPLGSKTVQWIANDGTGNSAPATRTITVTPVNDAPQLVVGGTLGYTENDPATVISTTATVADPDSADFNGGSLTVSLTANGTSADQLAIRNEGSGAGQIGVSGANVTYGGVLIGTFSGGTNGSNLVITFSSAAATQAAVQALVRNVTFANTSDAPSTLARTVSFTVVDGDGGTDWSSSTATVNVSQATDVPVVTTTAGASAYTEGGSAATVDGTLTVSDPDDVNLESATVSISAGFQAGDQLVFVNTPQITGSYNSGTGVLTLTGTDTLANYQAALRSITFSTSNDNPLGSKTVQWIANDGTGNSAPATRTITVTPVNDAPQLVVGGTLGYTENDPATVISTTATVADPDSADLNGGSLTVSFTANGTSADQLAIRNEGSGVGQIGVSGANVTYGGVLIGTFSGGTNGSNLVISFSSAAATQAAVQALVRNVTFANTSDAPSTLARTVSFTVVDGDGGTDSGSSTATVNVSAVNDAPTVTTSGGGTAFTEAGTAVVVDASLTLSDLDNSTFVGATVQITGSFQSGQDVLAFPATPLTGNISAGAFDAGTGTLTLSSAGGTATTAEWQTALRAVTFDSGSTSPGSARIVSFQLNDGQAANNLSLVATKSIAINETNSSPTVTVTGGSVAFVENAPAVAVDAGILVGDPDTGSLTGATVRISTGFSSTEDVLTFTPVGSITGLYVPATGILTLSGTGTLAEYQQVLASVKYDNTSDTPSTTTRTIEFQVDDGQSVSNLSTVQSRTVTVAATNDAPAIVVGAILAYTENGTAAVIAPAATVADVDSADLNGGSLTIGFTANGTTDDQLAIRNEGSGAGQIGASAGTVSFGGVAIGTFSGGANGANLAISFNSAAATPAAVQALTRNITYSNTSENPSTSARTLTFTVVDGDGGSESDSDTATVNVTTVNDAPAIAGSVGTPLDYTENDPATPLDNGITLSDVDSATLTGATVSVSANFVSGQDVLLFTPAAGIGFNFSAGTGVLTLSGSQTLANYQAALRNIRYFNTSEDPSTATRTISFQVDDGAGLNNLSNVITRDVEVTSVNDAPTITAGGSIAYTENASAMVVSSVLTLADAEADTITGATATISANYVNGQDTLSFTTSGSITGNFNSTTGVLTLTGSGTAAEYQTALRSVTYVNSSDAPSGLARTVSFAATDSVGDTSAGATTTVNVTPVNDAPVTTVPASASIGTAFSNTNLAIAGVSVSDADAASGNIQTVVTAGNGTVTFDLAGGALAPANGTGAVTLTGTAAQINAALATLTYKSADGFTGSTTISVLTSDLGNTGTGGTLQSNGGVANTFQVGVVPQVFIIENTNGVADDANSGTSANPFNTIAAFNTLAVDGTGDYIYLRNGTGTYSEADGFNLLNNQQLIGQGQTLQFTNPVTGEVVTVGTGASGTTPTVSITGAANHAIDLGQGNTVKGLNVATTLASQTGISDSGGTVGSLTVSDVDVTGTGMAVDIDAGGTLAVTIDSLSSTASASQAIDLQGVGGSLTVGNGTISGATLGAINLAGTASLTYSGNITQTANAVMVNVSGHSAGTVTFNGGTLNATNGTGLNFVNADGTYNFNGTTTLNGGDAGIDILNGSDGTFDFDAGTITNPTGAAFSLFDNNANVTYSGNISDSSGYVVQISNHDAGTVTFQDGSITSTGTGIRVDNSNGGFINFNGQTTLTTGTAIAVDLAIQNSGGTVNFNPTGTGLDITTTSGSGFVATGGGTVSVAGTANTISSGTGIALNVANTTIGANDLNFQSISSSGAVNGIVLNNTGASGGLTVTGTGTTGGSGGTILNSTGDGISATNTRDLLLSNMNITGADGNGISAAGTQGMALTNVSISNSNGHGINASNLLGTNTLSNSTITGFDSGGVNTENGLNIVNTGSNALTSMTVSNTTFSNGTTGNDGIFMEAQGSGNMTLAVTGSTFTGLFGDGVQVNGITGATGTVRLTISGSTFTTAVAGTGNGGISMNPFGDINFIADINGNTLTDIIDHVVTLGAIGVTNGGTADADITIRNNTISSNLGGRGITVTADGGTTDLLIDNNSVDSMGTTSSYAIVTNFTNNPSLGTTATGNVTISNNDIGQLGPLWTSSDGTGGAIWLNTQAGSTMTAALTNNLIDANTASVIEAVWLRSIGGSTLNVTATGNNIDDTAGTSVELNVQAGLSTTQAGTVNLNMSGNNLNGGGLRLTENSLGTINITQTDASTLSTANGSPIVSAIAGSAFYGAPPPPTPSTPSLPLIVLGEPLGDGATALTEDQFASIILAAVLRWQSAGLTQAQHDTLANLTFAIVAMDGDNIGASASNLVLIDDDAGGRGWFVDSTPLDDAEFFAVTSGTQLAATDSAAGGVDLLTAVMHEIGHTLGLSDTYSVVDADALMYGYLAAGERRLPEVEVELVGFDFGGASFMDSP